MSPIDSIGTRPKAATNPPPHILVVDDEADFRNALCGILNLEGYRADGVDSIAGYIAWHASHSCDVLIVDRRLPDGDGLEIVRLHRRSGSSPVVVLTARGQVADRIAGIDADADHYLVKPVATEELLAVLRQFWRRADQGGIAEWRIDTVAWRLIAPASARIPLTRREVLFLAQFIGKPGVAVPRPTIFAALGEDPALFDPRRLEIMVRRLRHKVEEAGVPEFPLVTVYGAGYAFNGWLNGL